LREDVTRPGLAERALFLLFPARCLWCGKPIAPEGFFCKACKPSVLAAKPRRFQLERPGKVLEVRAPALYRGGYRETLHRYKFQEQKGLAGQLGRFTAGQAVCFGLDFDAVTYVPLSRQSYRDRGYDQSGLLAKNIARALGVPLWPLLEKTRETKRQHKLGRTERLGNVKGAYSAESGAQGKCLLLVDDIVTTGATLCQCAEALYEAGAAGVYAVCAASAQKKEGQDGGAV